MLRQTWSRWKVYVSIPALANRRFGVATAALALIGVGGVLGVLGFLGLRVDGVRSGLIWRVGELLGLFLVIAAIDRISV